MQVKKQITNPLLVILILLVSMSSHGQPNEHNDSIISEFPFFEDFSGVTPPELPAYWSKFAHNPDLGTVRVETTTITTPISEPNHVRMTNDSYENAVVMLITPEIAQLDSRRISFWARNNTLSNVPDLVVGSMSDPSDADTFTPFKTFEGGEEFTNTYTQYHVIFDDSIGDDSYIAIRHGGTPSLTRTIYLDNFLIVETPTTPILFVNIKEIDFGTLVMGTVSEKKKVEISNIGIDQLSLSPDDIFITGANADSFILENLDSVVELDPFETATISVIFSPVQEGHKQAKLHVDDLEIPLSGESVDPTITEFPHFEDFNKPESPDLPLGWNAIINNPDLGTANVETTTIGSPMSEPQHVRIVSNNYEDQTVMLISPPIPDLAEKRIRFWSSCNSSTNIPDLIIGTMSDPDNEDTFTPFRTIEADEELTGSYQQFAVTFDDSVGEDEYIAFLHGTTPTFTRSIYIDDVLIEHIPDGPVMVVYPDSWEFADTQIGATSFAKEFVITNEGVDTLTVAPEDIAITGVDADRFILENLPETIHLAAFESDTISVIFAPEQVGDKQATLMIDDLQVPLTGKAFDATITDYPHLEDFHDVTTPDLPYGWTKIVDNPGMASAAVETTDSGDPVSAPNHVRLFSDDTEDADVMLISPPFSELNNKRLRFYAKSNLTTSMPVLIVGTMGNPADVTSFQALDTIQAGYMTNSYDSLFTVMLDSRVGEDQFVAFRHGGTPSHNRYIYLDNIFIEDAPDEPLLVVQPDGETHFGELQTGTVSEAQPFVIMNDGGGTLTIGPNEISITGVNDDAFVLDNLEEQVHLDFGETATIHVAFAPQAVGEKQATLMIDQVQIPLTGEGFDATITEVPHFEDFSDVSTPELPFGWNKIVYNPDLGSATVETTSSQSPLSDPAHARLYSNNHDDQDVILISPPVENLDEMRVRFWVKCNMSTNVPDLIVGTMSNPTDASTFTEVYTIPADQITTSYDEEHTINFSSAIGDDQFVAFKHGGTPNWARSLYIDNILLDQLPDEPLLVIDPKAHDFDVQQIGTSSEATEFALLNDGGGTLTIAPGDISITGANSDEFTLNNLSDTVNLLPGETAVISVAFEPVDVGDKTAALNVLEEEAILTGEGIDATVTEFPWTEDFLDDWTGEPEAPQGWTVVNGAQGSYWEQSDNHSYSGDHSARTYQGSASNNLADEWLITPPLDLDQLDNALLSYYGYISQAPTGTRENMRVLILDEVYSNIDDLHANATLLEVNPFSRQWENYTIDISEYSGIKHIAFHYHITADDDASFAWLYVDDVQVKEAPLSYEVTFQVRCEDDNLLQGALIELLDLDSLNTDANGEATIDLYDGTYSAQVTKEGFEDTQADFTVDGEPLTVDVTLVQNVFTLELESNPEHAGSVNGEGDYGADENVTAEAVPNTGYVFVNWTDETQEIVNTEPIYSFDMPWNDLTLTANFEAEEYNITFLVAEFSDDEDPVEGAIISIDGFEDLITGPNGEATIELANGSYTADVSTSGYEDEQVTFTVDSEDKTVEVHLSDIIEVPFNLDIVTEGLPHGEAQFSWEHITPGKAFVGYNVYLNDDLVAEEVPETLYLFANLTEGEYTAGVRAVYTTGESDIVNKNFEIEAEQFTVTFSIADEDAQPVTGATITFDGVTNDPGDYVFEGITAGTYAYTVEKDGYLVVEDNLTVEDNTLEEVILQQETFTVTFDVRDAQDDPVTGATITFDGVTNNPGEYVFEEITAGTYAYTVEKDGYLIVEDDLTVEDDTFEEVILQQETFTVTFDVRDDQDDPVTGATITFDGVTNNPGDYVFEEITAGTYDFLVEKTGYKTKEGGVTVTDEDMEVTVILETDDVMVDDPHGDELIVYPNPATDYLYIRSNEKIKELRLVDMLGQVVYMTVVDGVNYQLNVSDLEHGLYFVQIRFAEGYTTKRLQITGE